MSDHLTMVYTYDQWRSAGRDAWRFCSDNFINPSTMSMIDSMRDQFSQLVASFALTTSGGGGGDSRIDRHALPPSFNRNASNAELIKAVVASALSPNVIFVHYKVGKSALVEYVRSHPTHRHCESQLWVQD